jgi:two-component system chemotaxis response regulator CheB
LLDDGAAGLLAVKQCGGVAVVQDPVEADFPDMIHSAQRAVTPDYCIPVEAMPALLAKLIKEPVPARDEDPGQAKRLEIEAGLVGLRRDGAKEVAMLGKTSRLVCPECNGTLWELDDEGVLRFRCHIGHAYTAGSLAADQADALERALGVALRTLDDTAALSGRLADEAEAHKRVQSALVFRRRSEEARRNAETVREILAQQKSLRPQPREAGPNDGSRTSA